MRSITLSAPAKVNLFLKVLSKRKDGYHDILTLFERISLADKIRITKIPEGITVRSDKFITARAEDNIACKAARMVLGHAGVRAGVRIEIKKVIPVAAGLGGGSSDAAAVLSGINRLFGLNMDNDNLMRMGSRLGADVPFFILNTPFAIGRGIGDRLERAKFRMKLWHLVVYPGFKMASKDVYRAFDASVSPGRGFALTGAYADDKMTFPRHWNGMDKVLRNDLEGVVIDKRPVVGKIIKCLVSSLGRRAIVSGSGPSVFCLYGTREEAVKAKERIFRGVPPAIRKRWRFFIVETKT